MPSQIEIFGIKKSGIEPKFPISAFLTPIHEENFAPRGAEYPKSATRKHSEITITWKNSDNFQKNVLTNFKGTLFANIQ